MLCRLRLTLDKFGKDAAERIFCFRIRLSISLRVLCNTIERNHISPKNLIRYYLSYEKFRQQCNRLTLSPVDCNKVTISS